MARLLRIDEFDNLLARISGFGWSLVAPVRVVGRGRFSGTDLTRYEAVRSYNRIAWDCKTYLSPKQVVFPVRQVLLRFAGESVSSPSDTSGGVLLLCRACDIHAIRRLDNIFLLNGPHIDPYYAALRNRVRFVLLECPAPFDTCFCVAMGTNAVDGYSAVMRPSSEGVLIEALDDPLREEIERLGAPAQLRVVFAGKNGAEVTLPDTHHMPPAMYDHPMWESYSRRCIACGRCNTSCPTCSCFSVYDRGVGPESATAERMRVWDGCHLDGFTNMAGGVVLRRENGERMRFKTFHKIYDYYKRFGVHMCVGCGRCDDVCPEHISFAACINMLGKIRAKEV